jgi:hypothetical protein
MAGDRFFLLAIAGFSAAPAFQSARRAGGGELPEENEIARLPDPAFRDLSFGRACGQDTLPYQAR